MDIRFVTRNTSKEKEVKAIMGNIDISIIFVERDIQEILTKDIREIVRDKAQKAFHKIGRRVFIEQTGFYINSLNRFPGSLSEVFWETLEADKISELLGGLEDTSLTATTVIAYCDGKKIHLFDGSIDGNISPEPKGDRAYAWDCVFIPDEHNNRKETFAEMGEKKNEISMRKKAFDKFIKHLLKETG